ncbi:hypothetical protein HPB47_011544 [Ixodes persulcatus]|uniref:Uncharacterized protein n=1 Tax=Ixodes persulcatus TaxID=34615 RepID=A0AC60NVZ5_IXOPE|nr:hypothetical protein HPB47_011544 [Ixodes persulcatus]
MASVQLADMRKPYVSGTLLEKDLPTLNPIELFEMWFLEVKEGGLMYESNAVALSTTTKTGYPSSRMVLLKGYGPDGFVFFTNYNSRKGRELEENPNASLLFYWDRHHRQVRVEGTVERTSVDVSDKYFHSRPRDSQLSAVVSRQSHVIESRAMAFAFRYITPFPRFERTFGAPGRVRAMVAKRARPVGDRSAAAPVCKLAKTPPPGHRFVPSARRLLPFHGGDDPEDAYVVSANQCLPSWMPCLNGAIASWKPVLSEGKHIPEGWWEYRWTSYDDAGVTSGDAANMVA